VGLLIAGRSWGLFDKAPYCLSISPTSPSGMNDIDHISSIPIELLRYICTHLANRNIKSLRLACKLLAQRTHTRQTRVFLSANPCNIAVSATISPK
jgi:hypothetical protein